MEEKAKIRQFILEKSLRGRGPVEGLSDQDSLFENGILDSLRFLELIAFVEKTFKVNVSMGEITMDRFESVDKIVDLIKEKQKEKK
jgi:acyl carrier protein